jgi:SAM-dependent methyltransferase
MSSFDEVSIAYDSSIDWAARLSKEMPFLLKCLPMSKRPRVLDMACGSGRHAVALTQEGADVIGLDSSIGMISAARAHAEKEGVNAKFLVADMRDVENAVKHKLDLVICLGNSLALLPTFEDVRRVIASVYLKLASAGSFVFQVLNFEEIRKAGFRFFPTKAGRMPNGEETVLTRFFEHSADGIASSLVVSAFNKSGVEWSAATSTQRVLNLNPDAIKEAVVSAGFRSVDYYSDYQELPFERLTARDLVVRARQ